MIAGRVYSKPNVHLWEIDPELLEGLAVAANIFGRHGLYCMVTSLNDDQHRTNSLHYKGRAMDLRSHHAPESCKDDILAELRAALGDERWDILLERRGEPGEHYHLEIDPIGD